MARSTTFVTAAGSKKPAKRSSGKETPMMEQFWRAKKEQPDARVNVVVKDDPARHLDKARETGTMESKGSASGEAKDIDPKAVAASSG